MDVTQKLKDLKSAVQDIDTEERQVTSRISELRQLVETKKKKEAKLDKLKAEEAALLEELGA